MRWMMYKLAVVGLVLLGTGCDQRLRWAAMDGVESFVTSTVSGTLSTLFPVSDMLKNANGG